MLNVIFFVMLGVLIATGIILFKNKTTPRHPNTDGPIVPPIPLPVPAYPSYEVVSEQCSGELSSKVMYDTTYRIYIADVQELNSSQKVKLQTLWKYSNGEIASIHTTGLINVSDLLMLNDVWYYETQTPISIEINATQAELTAHITISVFDGNTNVQTGQDTQFTHDILFACRN